MQEIVILFIEKIRFSKMDPTLIRCRRNSVANLNNARIFRIQPCQIFSECLIGGSHIIRQLFTKGPPNPPPNKKSEKVGALVPQKIWPRQDFPNIVGENVGSKGFGQGMSFGLKTKQRRRDEGDQKFSPKRKIQLRSEICNTNTLYDWRWLVETLEGDWEVKGGALETHPPIHPSNLVTSYSYFSFIINGLKRKYLWVFLLCCCYFHNHENHEEGKRKEERTFVLLNVDNVHQTLLPW